ncbi:hypothetical protein ACVILL_003294 [Bradyrhizobium sp. USDA 3364]
MVFPYHGSSEIHVRGTQGGPARLQVNPNEPLILPIDQTNGEIRLSNRRLR